MPGLSIEPVAHVSRQQTRRCSPTSARRWGRVKRRLGRDRLRIFDAFAGSGVVSRFFKAHAHSLVSNDFEDYAAVVGRCYLRNRSTVNLARVGRVVDRLNATVDTTPLPTGFIEEL